MNEKIEIELERESIVLSPTLTRSLLGNSAEEDSKEDLGDDVK